uniref:Uncharacterized protein n=1 Tax=Methanococcus maripaludis (strain C7 / ATCC BAA-1331) TaxID=426368 RepID=A6VJC7_METM7
MLALLTQIKVINDYLITFQGHILVLISLISFITLRIATNNVKSDESHDYVENNELFNLFYINISKVHEIAMLLDNKIMKTVEKQHSQEETSKSDVSLNLDKLGVPTINQINENRSKKSVYESFDVKTTKSIMLREIYSKLKNQPLSKNLGEILLFKNVELSQRNTDNLIMFLNFLANGNLKQVKNDSGFEFNISEVITGMLDDFTIDYTFNIDNEDTEYLIRIPYNSREYFENSYSHNDLQMGELSVIGIYRGKVNFSEMDSISSKFFELLSKSTNNDDRIGTSNNCGLKDSSKTEPVQKTKFPEYTKLEGEYHLIDLIAIIQELKIQDGESIE